MDAHKNLAYSTVATAPSPATSGTSLVVQAGAGALFPAVSFNATVWPAGTIPTTGNAEIVRVTVISTDTFTITRTQEGTSARAIVVGDQIAATITAKTITDIENAITGVAADGWLDDTAETWTYASGSGGGLATFTVTGDVTAKYTPGTRIKLTQSATVKYFVVTASSVSSGTTTVTIMAGSDYTLANSGITLNYHSYEANPQGYPGWFAFTPGTTGWSATPTTQTRFSVVGRTVTFQFNVSGTSNATNALVNLPIQKANTTDFLSAGVRVENAGAFLTAPGVADIVANDTKITFFRDNVGNTWGNTLAKAVQGLVIYDI